MMKKKLSRIKHKEHRARRFVVRHKFIMMVASVVLLLAGFMLLNVIKSSYDRWQDEKNIRTTVRAMASIEARLAKKHPSITWKDQSHCTILQPRLFGEKEQFTCTSSYAAHTSIVSQTELDRLIDSYNTEIKYSTVIAAFTPLIGSLKFQPSTLTSGDNVGKMQLASASFLIKNLSTRKTCAINYMLSHDEAGSANLKIELKCTSNTLKAYYEPIEVQE